MSLGQFFRDYVYIPMGGNRRHQMLNLFVVWFLTGFWHGASWNFILWGLWFGVLIVIEKLFMLKVLKKAPVLSNIYLLFVVLIGWVMFYFTDLNSVKNCLAVMFVNRIEFNLSMYLECFGDFVDTCRVRSKKMPNKSISCTDLPDDRSPGGYGSQVCQHLMDLFQFE